ncbi:MerR family transcriptional regulator [Ruania albidiflava]|uniref:MerR family transcriptional regulator n=1 Tax=Ruania albidiflava TaxID=366586 RepID=UPI0023EFB309|nr:TipAS antibiotic-recognition domain-containing protein [Ruania albidiflava]
MATTTGAARDEAARTRGEGTAATDAPPSEWSMHEITRHTGTTSRTLRHYDQVGLLPPSRIGANGYRYYDTDALLRLQRILLLRRLGLGLTQIGEILDARLGEREALLTHLDLLRLEREQLDRRIAAVSTTLDHRDEGTPLMPGTMFDGFDHTIFEEEVTTRWGRRAWQSSDQWWRSLTAAEKESFGQEQKQIQADYAAAYEESLQPGDERVQAVTTRLHRWLSGPVPTITREYFLGLADLYVADDRFAANYGGTDGAKYVREAMRVYAETAQFDPS